jgi:hypothetical protein
MSVPEIFLNGEKYLLQTKVDTLMRNDKDKSLKVRILKFYNNKNKIKNNVFYLI